MNIQTVNFNGLAFINVTSPQEIELKYLRSNYGFNPLHLEDYVNRLQIPQIEMYKDYTLVVFDVPFLNAIEQKQEAKSMLSTKSFIPNILKLSPNTPKDKRIATAHVNFFIGKDYLIVLHDEKTPLIDEVFAYCQKTLKNRQEMMSDGPVFTFYRIADMLVDSSFPLLNHISSTIDSIDKRLEEGHLGKVVETISVTRRNIVVFQTITKQIMPIFSDLEKGKYERFNNLTPFWSNILDHLLKISDRLDDSKELNEGIASSYESLLTVRSNQIVKVLTVFTAILLPLTLVASIYGMNIHLPFEDHPRAFFLILEVMGIIAILMILIFKHKDWL